MNLHVLVDRAVVAASARSNGWRKYFAASLESVPIRDMLPLVSADLPADPPEGLYEVTAESPVGPMLLAFRIARWKGTEHPTIIYHHGNGERPLNLEPPGRSSFRQIFLSAAHPVEANLIAVRAAFHEHPGRWRMERLMRMDIFVAMMAAAVRLVEGLVRLAHRRGCRRVVVAGLSLGGWTANIHRAYLNTAEAYVPMLAATAFDQLFLGSAFRMQTGRIALERPEAVTRALSFEEDFFQVRDPNVFPLLARHDQLVSLERHQPSYAPHPVAVMDTGHVHGSLAIGRLRRHILPHVFGSRVADPGSRVERAGPAAADQ